MKRCRDTEIIYLKRVFPVAKSDKYNSPARIAGYESSGRIFIDRPRVSPDAIIFVAFSDLPEIGILRKISETVKNSYLFCLFHFSAASAL